MHCSNRCTPSSWLSQVDSIRASVGRGSNDAMRMQATDMPCLSAYLFNHGYYWEAHEAWEALWQSANRGSPLRAFLKGLILLSATGVKIREDKRKPAMRHAGRAGALLRNLTTAHHGCFSIALGMSPGVLADLVEARAEAMLVLCVTTQGQPEPVFDFVLRRGCESLISRCFLRAVSVLRGPVRDHRHQAGR